MSTLDDVPDELLEHIAFFLSTSDLLGPPAALPALLVLNRRTHRVLARAFNPHLYARIFAAKFDTAVPARRFGPASLSAPALTAKLGQRCDVLKRLRALRGARTVLPSVRSASASDLECRTRELDETLWTAFLMVLEDDGRNVAQLHDYARIDRWLKVYWFELDGASGAVGALDADRWPVGTAIRDNLAMWLLWFFFEPASYVANADLYRRAEKILKLVVLNAPIYPLSHVPWTSFYATRSDIHFGTPTTRSTEPINPFHPRFSLTHATPASSQSHLVHSARSLRPQAPPPAATPATLAYLALAARSRRDAHDLSIFGIGLPGVTILSAGELGVGGLGALDLAGLGRLGAVGDPFVAFPELWLHSSMGMGMDVDVSAKVTSGSGPQCGRECYGPDNSRWEYEWRRSVYAIGAGSDDVDADGNGEGGDVYTKGDGDSKPVLPARMFKPGSLEGTWEGSFTYTEFHNFRELLAGASPSKLSDCILAQHNQTWRVREYHLLASPYSSSTAVSSKSSSGLHIVPLPAGDPLHAHVPDTATIVESSEGLTITLPSSTGSGVLHPMTYTYRRFSPTFAARRSGSGAGVGTRGDRTRGGENGEGGEGGQLAYEDLVQDIILTGEGHSGWGEFRLLGRVRPCDGLVYVSKVYTGGDRGHWLYRGYLVGCAGGYGTGVDEVGVGDGGGHLVGRWRDTLTPAETHGYEGAFAMTRRR